MRLSHYALHLRVCVSSTGISRPTSSTSCSKRRRDRGRGEERKPAAHGELQPVSPCCGNGFCAGPAPDAIPARSLFCWSLPCASTRIANRFRNTSQKNEVDQCSLTWPRESSMDARLRMSKLECELGSSGRCASEEGARKALRKTERRKKPERREQQHAIDLRYSLRLQLCARCYVSL